MTLFEHGSLATEIGGKQYLYNRSVRYKKVYFFQCTTDAAKNYMNSSAREQIWTPWFSLAIAPIVTAHSMAAELIDARIESDWRNRLRKLGENDILAVSVMTGNTIKCAIEATEIVRNSGALIVWGGTHATLFPKDTLNQSGADMVVSGFAYKPWSYLCKCLESNAYVKNAGGQLFVKHTAEFDAEFSFELGEELPDYALSLIGNWEPYINKDVAINTRTVNFVSSEGCPMRCRFCSEPVTSSKHWLSRSAQSVTRMIKAMIAETDANGLKFHDANFFGNKKRAFDIVQLALKDLPISWAASIHPNDAIHLGDMELESLRDSGLRRLLIGLESPVPEIIKMAGKGYDPSQIRQLALKLRDHGIIGMFTYIVGWPNAPASHYQETIDHAYMIKDAWPEHQAKIHFLEPWPGTEIFRDACRAGYSPPNTLSEWADVDYYQEQYKRCYSEEIKELIRNANNELCPYVDA